ncbi:cytochrome b [Kineobactrum salinum]|uniref:Cytochrome b n=1 Tax=Kineobactrum salinum TaxID=2708301 RepID=A0A6C0U164_9GAMM|nr:cytochrome b [Kineobactrum salinum]QIB65771.1 cytochrome b [Kineobactrum salinum]
MLKDRPWGYGLVSIVLHWTSAIAILFLFGLGIYMVDLGYYDPWYNQAPRLHISIGLCLLLLMCLRLVWRVTSRNPEPLSSYSTAVRRSAAAAKLLLYLGVFAVLVTGYLITSAKGQGPSLFGWAEFPVLLQLSGDGVDRAGRLHEWLSWAVVIIAAGHGAAALLHQFVIRDGTLSRMLKPATNPSTKRNK